MSIQTNRENILALLYRERDRMTGKREYGRVDETYRLLSCLDEKRDGSDAIKMIRTHLAVLEAETNENAVDLRCCIAALCYAAFEISDAAQEGNASCELMTAEKFFRELLESSYPLKVNAAAVYISICEKLSIIFDNKGRYAEAALYERSAAPYLAMLHYCRLDW